MATKGTKVPAIKNVPSRVDPELRSTLDSIKEALEVRLGRRGDPRDRAVTIRELIDSGLAKELKDNPFDPNSGTTSTGIAPPGDGPGDLTTPPAPTGLSASGVFTAVILDWNIATYGNHAYTEIWRSETNEIGGAVLRSTTNAFVYTDEVGYGSTYYYWVRFVTTSNVFGPFNATEGVKAETAVDIGAVMTELSEELKDMPGFNTLLSDIDVTIDGVTLSLQSTLEGIDTAADAAQTAVNNLTTNTPRVIRSTSAPTARADSSSLQTGDIWIDTDNGNEIFIYTGSTWAASTAGSTSSSDTTLQTQITANGNSISQNASNLLLVAGVSDAADISTSVNITSLNSSISNAETNITTNANAISGLTTRVSATETDITAISSDVTELENTLAGYSGTSTVATALSGLQTQITSNDTDIADANTAINTKASAASVTALNVSLSNLETEVDGKTKTFAQDNPPTSLAIGDLWIDTNDSNKLYRAESVGADQVTSGEWVLVRDGGIAVNAGAISTLDSTVTQQGQTLTSNSNNITSLQNALSGYTGSGAVASAINTINSNVALKPITFHQAAIPTALAIGDIWMDSDDDNKVYRAESVGADEIKAGEWVSVRDAGISSNAQAITALQNTVNDGTTGVAATASALTSLETNVNLIPTNYYQSTAPSSGLTTGDIWVDSDDNQMYRWNGSAWGSIRDATISSNSTAITALQNTLTGYSGSTTVASAISGLSTDISQNATNISSNASDISDLEATVNNPTTGVSATAGALSNLTVSVNAIPAQFYQSAAPSASDSSLGDYWVDSDDGQRYRYNGSAWQSIRDSLITSTSSSLTLLTATVGSNTSDISDLSTAISDETQARASAISQLSATVNNKTQTFVSNNSPTAVATGDLWIDSDDNNKLYRWNGSSWVLVRETVNDTKATVFAQSSQPTASAVGDIWIDTDDDDKVYRWNGSTWAAVGIPTQASVTTLSNAVSDIEGNASASYVLQVNANGSVAGMVIEANASAGGTASAVQFVADKFAIWNDASASTAPFIVSNNQVFMKEAMIQNASITAAKIQDLAVEEAKINDLAVTNTKIANAAITNAKIQNATIEGAKIKDAAITNAKINDLDAGKINAGFISADRINSNSITADKLNVTDLTLPVTNNIVSGSTIGPWYNNTMRLRRVGEVGTEPGLYQGYVRIWGGTGQVKTASIVIGDGTFGSGSFFDLRNDFAYTNNSDLPTVPLSNSVSGGTGSGYAQYHSTASERWSSIARFKGTNSVAQISIMFRKTSSNTTSTYLYILAQGDGGPRYLQNVEYSFYRFSET